MRAFVTGGSGFVGRNLIGALKQGGADVVALARSDGAAQAVEQAGATVARGDLDDTAALVAGARGCDVVFHAAALTKEWARAAEWTRFNVDGTRRVLDAAKTAGAKRFVHVGTEAALIDGETPMVRVDETRPLPARPLPGYPASKADAERVVRAADGIEAIVVRPRMVWGAGDTSLLPKIVDAVRAGRFRWIGGGRALTSTCHVDNACEGLLRAAERGKHGEVYFVTDGAPVAYRDFLGALIAASGVAPPTATVPYGVAYAAAAVAEAAWSTLPLPGAPFATRAAVALIGQEVTVVDDKARRELGYVGATARDAALAAMGAAA